MSGRSFTFPWLVAPAKPQAAVAVVAANITWNVYNNFGGRSNYIHADELPSERLTITIEMTAAKIGRSMKKCEMRIGLPSIYLAAVGVPGVAGAAPSSCGVTLMPGRTRIRPFTTTRDSGVSPSRTTRLSPMACPSVT